MSFEIHFLFFRPGPAFFSVSLRGLPTNQISAKRGFLDQGRNASSSFGKSRSFPVRMFFLLVGANSIACQVVFVFLNRSRLNPSFFYVADFMHTAGGSARYRGKVIDFLKYVSSLILNSSRCLHYLASHSTRNFGVVLSKFPNIM